MLNYPAIFFLIALGSAGLGFSGIATGGVDTVKDLFIIFATGALIAFLVRKPSSSDSRDCR